MTLDTNSTGLPSQFDIVSVVVVPSVSGPFNVKIYKKDTFLDADKLASWENIQPALYYPTDNNTGGQAEEGFPIPYDDEDNTGELHIRITNLDSASRTYTVTILYEAAHSLPLFKILATSAVGTDVATAQPWFPSAGAVSVTADSTYLIDGHLRLTRSAGTVSHTTSLIFSAGTMTFYGITYKAQCNTGDVVTNAAENQTAAEVATAVVVKAASTSATEQISIRVTGILRVNAAGTFIPGFQYSSAPGGAPTVMAETYFRLQKVGNGGVAAGFVTNGTWA